MNGVRLMDRNQTLVGPVWFGVEISVANRLDYSLIYSVYGHDQYINLLHITRCRYMKSGATYGTPTGYLARTSATCWNCDSYKLLGHDVSFSQSFITNISRTVTASTTLC